MTTSVYRKTIQNSEKHGDMKLVTAELRRKYLVS